MKNIKDSQNKEYQQSEDTQLCYNKDTQIQVIKILESAFNNKTRLKFHFGDIKTGRDWNEENDSTGTIGRSTGTIKIPLLIKTSRSYGGGALMDNSIVKITDTKTKMVLYQHPQYIAPVVEIVAMKKLLKNHSFNSDMQYFEMIAESFVNGQISQAKEQFTAMPVTERKAMVKALQGDWITGIDQQQKNILIDLI